MPQINPPTNQPTKVLPAPLYNDPLPCSLLCLFRSSVFPCPPAHIPLVTVSLEVAVHYNAYPFAKTSLLENAHCNESQGTSALKLPPASPRRSVVTFSAKGDSITREWTG